MIRRSDQREPTSRRRPKTKERIGGVTAYTFFAKTLKAAHQYLLSMVLLINVSMCRRLFWKYCVLCLQNWICEIQSVISYVISSVCGGDCFAKLFRIQSLRNSYGVSYYEISFIWINTFILLYKASLAIQVQQMIQHCITLRCLQCG